MKLLLDELLDARLRHHLKDHDVFTVDYLGWKGLNDSELLDIAEHDGFDVLVTGDKNVSYQQNLAKRDIAVVTLSAQELRLLLPYLPAINAAIAEAQPGTFIAVECGKFSRRAVSPMLEGDQEHKPEVAKAEDCHHFEEQEIEPGLDNGL